MGSISKLSAARPAGVQAFLPSHVLAGLLLIVFFFAATSAASAQVIAGASSAAAGSVTNCDCTLTATTTKIGNTGSTSTLANQMLVIGVSTNLSQAANSYIASFTITDANNVVHNLTPICALNNGATQSSTVNPLCTSAAQNSGANMRVELWYLLAPPAGAYTTAIVFDNLRGNFGFAVGWQFFANVNQTTPIDNFNGGSGSGGNSPTIKVTSANGEDVLDTVSILGNDTLTPTATDQESAWSAASGTSGTDVLTAASLIPGNQNNTTPGSSTTTWKEGASQAWVIAGISIKPAVTTAAVLRKLGVQSSAGGNVVQWQSAYEIRNAGFNVYREQNGERVKLNRSLIAGAALLTSSKDDNHFGFHRSYSFLDQGNDSTSAYWLEDVDLSGTHTMHGPVYAGQSPLSEQQAQTSLANRAIVPTPQSHQSVTSSAGGFTLATRPAAVPGKLSAPLRIAGALPVTPARTQLTPAQSLQLSLASGPAVKIMVTQSGWYEITQPALVAAGFDSRKDPRQIRLFAEGQEQAYKVVQNGPPHSGLGPQDTIQFYGAALDLPSTGTRVYWLTQNAGNGIPITSTTAWGYDAKSALSTFPYTLTWNDRTTYLAALTTGTQNFFGEVIAGGPVQQTLNVAELGNSNSTAAQITVSVQGVIDLQPHDVHVNLNGVDLGDVSFEGMLQGTHTFSLPQGLLRNGGNLLTLTPEDGDEDVSVVNYVNLTYPHLFVASGNQLQFTAPTGSSVNITGFTNSSIRVIDITAPNAPQEVEPEIFGSHGSYQATFRVPGWQTATHTLLAFTPDALTAPAAIAANTPSSWYRDAGRKIVMIAYPDFIGTLTPLVNLRQSQGYSVGVVNVNSIYDEFGYGEHSADAVKNFLLYAQQNWQIKPEYVLLVGGASLDPRNYLGFGDLDFVPTEMIPTQELMTASDGQLVDFQNTGIESISIGRLPVRTVADAENVVSKIVAYETGSNGAWQQQLLFMADHDPTMPFESDTQLAETKVPGGDSVSTILLLNTDPATARTEALADWQQGKLLINYFGHGSEEAWDDGLLSDDDANTLDNAGRLPVLLSIDCLNGFFQDVYATSLAQSVLLAQNGGAVAVIASSGLTDADPEALLDQALLGNLFQSGKGMTLGTALRLAKQNVNDLDVRRTYNLFGDPAMSLKTLP